MFGRYGVIGYFAKIIPISDNVKIRKVKDLESYFDQQLMNSPYMIYTNPEG
jgi:hypothetical protein